MADYNELLKLLNGQQDQEEPMMSVGEPASISGINEQAKSPYQQEAPEITPEQVLDMPKMQQDIADYSKSESQSAQEARLKDTSGAIPDKKPMDAREEYAKLIEQYKERLNKPQEGVSWGDALPDILSGLYNIGVRAKGRNLPQMQLGSIERAKQSKARTRQEDLAGLQNLQKMYQQYMAMNQPKDKLSAKDQAYLDYYQKRLEATQQSQKKASEREERISRKQQLDSARSLIKDDPRTKKAYEQAMALEDIQPLVQEVKSGNQNAAAALGTRLARAMGEVGVLTDADVTRYVQGTSWGRKLQDWAKKGYDGAPSQETLNEIIKNADTISKKLQGNLKNVYKNAESRMKTAYPDLDESTIKGLLGTAKFEEESQPVPQKIRIEVNGKIGTVPQDKVEALLKKYPNAKILE